MDNEDDIQFLPSCFDALFRNARQNAVLLMGGDGVITAVSPAFTLSFGYTSQDLSGRYFACLYTAEDREKGVPENELRNVMQDGRSSDNNYLVNKDGSYTWVAGESIRVRNNEGHYMLFKMLQNIHRQKVSEVELRRANELNEDILRSIDDVVIVLDESMQVVKVNNAFYRLFKRSDTESSYLDFTGFITSFDVNNSLLNTVSNAVDTGKVFHTRDVEITTALNEKRIFDVTCIPIGESVQRLLLVIHDVTVHKLIEREREDTIGFVAHELRNPLANLVLCNEIMGDSIADNRIDQVKDMLQRSKSNVMRLHKMIGELYDVTKANSGNLRLEMTDFHMGNMLKEAIDTVQVLQPAYNIIVNGDSDIAVRGDRYRLMQVITNYLSNGIKYSNGKTDVVLTVQHSEGSVVVSVKDEGLGIPGKQLPFIFDRFFRAEKTRNIEGVGLGLYLCSQIIKAHKGQAWADSEEGKGSTFYFSIPRWQ